MKVATWAVEHGQILQPKRSHSPTAAGMYYQRVPKAAGADPADWRSHYVQQLKRKAQLAGRDEYLLHRLLDGWLPVIRVTRYRDENNRLKSRKELAAAPADYRWYVRKHKPTARQKRN